jgi:hypothetical protein
MPLNRLTEITNKDSSMETITQHVFTGHAHDIRGSDLQECKGVFAPTRSFGMAESKIPLQTLVCTP